MYQCVNRNQEVITASKLLPRENDYCCPECLKELHLCAGKIRVPYFAHTFNESCKHKDEKPVIVNPTAQKQIAVKSQIMKIIDTAVEDIIEILV